MTKQADEHPHLHQVHARLSPEWKPTAALVERLLEAEDAEAVSVTTEALVARGEMATRVLIDLVRTLVQKS